LCPICTPYEGYMKSEIFQKSQKKAKIGQKGQIFQKKSQKMPKMPKNAKKKSQICQIFGFLDIWEQVAVCHFGGYIKYETYRIGSEKTGHDDIPNSLVALLACSLFLRNNTSHNFLNTIDAT
jgi:hypothetical protein